MLTYKKLAKRPSLFRSFTGMTIEEFDKLYEFAESRYDNYEIKRLSRKDRINAIGQGRDFNLPLEDRLIALLTYYRQYVTYTLLGFMVDLDQSNICRDIQILEPLVKRCIPLPEKVHERIKKIGTMEELLQYYPELKAVLDTTEQEIPRPKSKKKRQSHYSGKKKRHTVKTQLLVNKKGLILHKTRHKRGRRHDYDICKEKPPYVPHGIKVEMDLGFQGIQEDFPEIDSNLPAKKRKGRKLTKKQKKYNKELGSSRVIVENVIAKVKAFRIIGQEFRNRLNSYDTKMSVAMGLVNFKAMLKDGMDVSSFVG